MEEAINSKDWPIKMRRNGLYRTENRMEINVIKESEIGNCEEHIHVEE